MTWPEALFSSVVAVCLCALLAVMVIGSRP
jgi:hypothetical protein